MTTIFKAREIGMVNFEDVVMVVGMCPGRQRKKDVNCEVWHGNRSGDLMEEAVAGAKNLYLTNVFNYRTTRELKDSKTLIEKGVSELLSDIRRMKPVKIICMGNFAYNHVFELISPRSKIKIVKLPHPSFVIRFNKGRQLLIDHIREEVRIHD